MATPRQIRGRIRVAKNIEKITYAMKMVAAARLRRAQEAVGAARPYAEKMREVLQSLSGGIGGGGIQHPLLRRTDEPAEHRRHPDHRRPGSGRGVQLQHHPPHRPARQGFRPGARPAGLHRQEGRDVFPPPGLHHRLRARPSPPPACPSPRPRSSPRVRPATCSRTARWIRPLPGLHPVRQRHDPAPPDPADPAPGAAPEATPPPRRASPPTTSSSRTRSRFWAALLPRYVDTQVYQAVIESVAS